MKSPDDQTELFQERQVMMRTMIVAAVFPLFISVHGPIMAANLEFDMQIKCRVDESRSLTNQKQYHGAKKAMRIQSWFSHWLFNDDNYSKNSAIEFNWTPWTPNGPSLKIAADNTVHNSIRLLSRTKDSLIAVTSASDTLTAEGWLFYRPSSNGIEIVRVLHGARDLEQHFLHRMIVPAPLAAPVPPC
jgi:hypothetical protein